MDAAALKKWRETLGLSRSQAAEKLGVWRATIRNWEIGCRIPYTTSFACEAITKQWKQGGEFGPVTLIYADRPICLNPESRHGITVLYSEFHDNNKSALARARLLASEAKLHNPVILDSNGDVVWNTRELSEEYKNKLSASEAQQDADASRTPLMEPRPWWEVLYGTKVVSGRQVRAARSLLGWSQEELARASGMSPTTIRHFETAANDSIKLRTASKLRHAIELAGIEFIENGVRLRVGELPRF